MIPLLTRFRTRYDQWRVETYPKLAPMILTFCLVVSTSAAVGVLWLTKVQNDEQDRRAEAIRGLLTCFDTYAGRSAMTSKAVRVASENVTTASTEASRQLAGWTALLLSALVFKGPEESPEALRIVLEFTQATTDLEAAQTAVVAAQDELAAVREENPVPDPPSTFCEVRS